VGEKSVTTPKIEIDKTNPPAGRRGSKRGGPGMGQGGRKRACGERWVLECRKIESKKEKEENKTI